jgi:alcohol dehydrogenase class IV
MFPSANWNYPTAVRFGPGRLAELGQACQVAGITRPLLVTDPGILPLPIFVRAVDALDRAGLDAAVFSDQRGYPGLDYQCARHLLSVWFGHGVSSLSGHGP